MTISSTTRKVGPLAGNGITTAFPFTFKVFQASDLLVVLTNTGTGIQVTQVLTSQYTVALNANQDSNPGGTVTMTTAPPTGYTLTISSQEAQTQGTVLTNTGGFYPTVLNNAFDYLTILIQQLQQQLNQTLGVPLSDPTGLNLTLPAVANRASGTLGFDAYGNVTVIPAGSAAGGTSYQYPGGIIRTMQAKLQETVSVLDFGADPTGVADSTTAIQNALNASRNVFVPPGNYLYSTLSIPASTILYGASPDTTTLTQTSATLDGLVPAGANVSVSGLNFVANVTKTAGAFLNTNGQNYIGLANFTMSGAFQGVKISGGAVITIGSQDEIATIRNTVASTGRGIYVTGSNFEVSLIGIGMDAPNASQPQAGIYIDNTGDTTIAHCNIIHQGSDLLLAPGTGQVIASIFANDTFFDTSLNAGLNVAPTGTGAVVRCRFNGCWFSSSSTSGVVINGATTSIVQGMHFIDPHCIENATDGIRVAQPVGVTDLTILGGELCQNGGNGISFVGATSEFIVMGATIGYGAGLVGNSGYGIYFVGAPSNCVIEGNKLLGNTTGAIALPGSVGGNVRVANNAGFNPVGVGGITVGASPFTYTAGITPETIMVNGGTVSAVAVNGFNVFLQTNCTVPLSAGETVTVTYSAAPTMAKYRH